MRSGRYITQPNQYKAFIPTNLPPEPPIHIAGDMQSLLTDANIAIGKLDTMGYLAPNLNHIIAMYVRKEALLSSQIEGTQATLENILDILLKNHISPSTMQQATSTSRIKAPKRLRISL